jgi:hypothetical protein
MSFLSKRIAFSPLRLSFALNRRTLYTTRPTFNSHNDHHHEEQAEENFLDNPKYIFFFVGLTASSGVLYLDSEYRDRHGGVSWFAKFINVAPREEINELQDRYNVRIAESRDFHELLFLNEDPENTRFGRIGGVNIVPRGSPFNAEPGDTLINADELAPRRQPRSIFD